MINDLILKLLTYYFFGVTVYAGLLVPIQNELRVICDW